MASNETVQRAMVEGGEELYLYAAVRADGLGRCSIIDSCLAASYDEAARQLFIPEDEEYQAGRLGGSPVYRENTHFISGPFEWEEEMYFCCQD